MRITASLYVGIEFFLRVIPIIKPKLFHLGVLHEKPVIAYSDAEWTPPAHPPLLPGRGLGGCILLQDQYLSCSINTPMKIVDALNLRATQIIPLELIAAAGLLQTFGERIRGRNVIFFIDNQSVCGVLTKGVSKSRDLQHLSTAWHILCAQLGCRVWIEWVPSKSNPADILSRHHRSEDDILDLYDSNACTYKEMVIPEWADQGIYDSIQKVLDAI